jgi:hypothetical protein
MAANPRFTWHKLTCPAGCGRVERYRGLAVLGAPGHICYGCKLGPMRVSEVHWGHEKYATSRGKAGTVEKLPKTNPAAMPTAGRSKIDIINDAAAGQYQKIYELHGGKQRKILLDMTTARAIVTVYRALSPANQEKFLRYPISRMGQIAWTLLGKQNPSPMHVASLLFDKRVFTPAQARAWAHAHGFKYGTVELGGPASRYVHLPQQPTGRVKRIVPFGSRYSGIRAIVARNPGGRFAYVYRPGVLDRVQPTIMAGHPIAPGTLVRRLAKRPAGGRAIRGWGRTFAWIADAQGNEQIVFRKALQKTSATGY